MPLKCDCCGAFDGELNADWANRVHRRIKTVDDTHHVKEMLWGNLCQFCSVPEVEFRSMTGDPTTARCGKCSQAKKKASFRHGLTFVHFLWCRECRSEYHELYEKLAVGHQHKLHPERLRDWQKRNPEKMKKYSDNWKAKHPKYWVNQRRKRKEKTQ